MLSRKVKVSYLIALYNKESYILECIRSVLKEISNEIEIEICIVNDGSSDSSGEVVENMLRQTNNIKYFSFPTNKGKNAAYNKAFKMSTGDFICLLGADDVLVRGRTSKLLSEASENVAVFGSISAFKDSHHDLNIRLDCKSSSFPNIFEGNTLSGGAGLFSASQANNIFPIPESLKFEDWWVSYKLYKSYSVLIIKDVVLNYRVNSNNDCGLLTSFVDIKNDYRRHIPYLQEFLLNEPSLSNYIRPIILYKKSFVGSSKSSDFLDFSCSMYYFKAILCHILSGEYAFNINRLLKNKND